jgi:periplasmic divalent cation tolerance protein
VLDGVLGASESLIALRSGDVHRGAIESTALHARVQEEFTEYKRKSSVPEPSSFVIVLCTFPADQDPLPLVRTLVGERLAACVNVLPPMRSIYRWDETVEQAMEYQLVIKTRAERVEAITARIGGLHPYDVPEVLVLEVAGGAERYLAWLQANA